MRWLGKDAGVAVLSAAQLPHSANDEDGETARRRHATIDAMAQR
jgi:hypothetical protein